jgi:hypothetical protein
MKQALTAENRGYRTVVSDPLATDEEKQRAAEQMMSDEQIEQRAREAAENAVLAARARAGFAQQDQSGIYSTNPATRSVEGGGAAPSRAGIPPSGSPASPTVQQPAGGQITAAEMLASLAEKGKSHLLQDPVQRRRIEAAVSDPQNLPAYTGAKQGTEGKVEGTGGMPPPSSQTRPPEEVLRRQLR